MLFSSEAVKLPRTFQTSQDCWAVVSEENVYLVPNSIIEVHFFVEVIQKVLRINEELFMIHPFNSSSITVWLGDIILNYIQ